jgi:hypothetical protein
VGVTTSTIAPVRGLAGRLRRTKGPTEAPAALVVTSRHQLWQRYGSDGVFAIERALGDLFAAMAERGLAGTLVYADDSPLLSCLGVLPADPTRPESVARVIQGVSARLAWTEEAARYVLLVGDDGIVPFHRLPNPSQDGDEVVWSDHPYGVNAGEPLLPARAVGRIPDSGLATLIGSIRAAATAHRHLAAGQDLAATGGAFGYSASVWKRASRAVFAALGDTKAVRLSPPLTHQDRYLGGEGGPRYRYFNLHGLVDSPHWFGQRHPSFPADYPSFPIALCAADLESARGSVVFSEACYGAHIEGRAVTDSIALTSLARGTLAFVGATGVAYGGLDDGPLVSADLLAHRFWQALRAGLPAGEALAAAKRALIREATASQGYLDAEDEKAIYTFVLYGDPSLVHQRPSAWAEDAAGGDRARGIVEWAGPVDVVGTRPVRPSHVARSPDGETDGAAVPCGLVDHVRGLVARQLPEFAAPDVGVEVSASPSNRQPKDLTAPDAPPAQLVVTLRRSVCFCEGPSCHEIVRVTVDRRGRVWKMAVTR